MITEPTTALAMTGAGEGETGRAGETGPAESHETEMDVPRNGPNAYRVCSGRHRTGRTRWRAPNCRRPAT